MGCNCGKKKTRITARLTSESARKAREDEIVGFGLSQADRKRKIEILKRKKVFWLNQRFNLLAVVRALI